MRRATIAMLVFVLPIAGAFLAAGASPRIKFDSSTFLALWFALCCAQLAFLPLVLGPLLRQTNTGFGTVGPRWAFAILCSGAASAVSAVAVFVATGSEAWLWAAVPACVGSGLLLFAVAQLRRGVG